MALHWQEQLGYIACGSQKFLCQIWNGAALISVDVTWWIRGAHAALSLAASRTNLIVKTAWRGVYGVSKCNTLRHVDVRRLLATWPASRSQCRHGRVQRPTTLPAGATDRLFNSVLFGRPEIILRDLFFCILPRGYVNFGDDTLQRQYMQHNTSHLCNPQTKAKNEIQNSNTV